MQCVHVLNEKSEDEIENDEDDEDDDDDGDGGERFPLTFFQLFLFSMEC